MATGEVVVYRVRAATLPSHRHPKPVVIVWTKGGIVAEQKSGEASTTRNVIVGQIDVHPAGTIHSLRALKGSLHFTLIELRQQGPHDPKVLPNKLSDCEKEVGFPEGGFACLLRIAPDQQITIPELDVNSFSIAIDSGRVRNTIPRSQWETHYQEGQVSYLPGYEQHAVQNLERRPLRLALIVQPPAE